jgi:hypothetical protein
MRNFDFFRFIFVFELLGPFCRPVMLLQGYAHAGSYVYLKLTEWTNLCLGVYPAHRWQG